MPIAFCRAWVFLDVMKTGMEWNAFVSLGGGGSQWRCLPAHSGGRAAVHLLDGGVGCRSCGLPQRCINQPQGSCRQAAEAGAEAGS